MLTALLVSPRAQAGRDASKTQSRGTNVQAKDIVIQATQGDITATAAKLQADNITLDAAKNVNLIAAANLETNTSTNHSDSVGVGVTVGLGQNSGISLLTPTYF